MFMSHHQNAGQNHNKKTANKSFKNMTKLNYLETTIKNQNYIHDKVKSR